MEHRWGNRVSVDIPVKLTAKPFLVRAGRITNLSVSGGFVRVPLDARVLSRIQVVIELPLRFRHATPVIAAYVARKAKDGLGIEWCEFAPQAIVELLRAANPRPRGIAAIEAPESAAPPVPLWRHGT